MAQFATRFVVSQDDGAHILDRSGQEPLPLLNLHPGTLSNILHAMRGRDAPHREDVGSSRCVAALQPIEDFREIGLLRSA